MTSIRNKLLSKTYRLKVIASFLTLCGSTFIFAAVYPLFRENNILFVDHLIKISNNLKDSAKPKNPSLLATNSSQKQSAQITPPKIAQPNTGQVIITSPDQRSRLTLNNSPSGVTQKDAAKAVPSPTVVNNGALSAGNEAAITQDNKNVIQFIALEKSSFPENYAYLASSINDKGLTNYHDIIKEAQYIEYQYKEYVTSSPDSILGELFSSLQKLLKKLEPLDFSSCASLILGQQPNITSGAEDEAVQYYLDLVRAIAAGRDNPVKRSEASDEDMEAVGKLAPRAQPLLFAKQIGDDKQICLGGQEVLSVVAEQKPQLKPAFVARLYR